MQNIHRPAAQAPAAGASAAPPARRRLTGVDAARGIALVGMISIHLLPSWDPGTFEPTVQAPAEQPSTIEENNG